MKSFSIKKVVTAGAFLAVAAIPAIPAVVHADPTDAIDVKEEVKVPTNDLASYVGGVELNVDVSDAADVTSIKYTAPDGTAAVAARNGDNISIRLPVLNADGTLKSGPQSLPITFVNADGSEKASTLNYTVTGVAPTYELDITVTSEIEIKESAIGQYKDGLKGTIYTKQITDADPAFKQVQIEGGSPVDIKGETAEIMLPVLKADGTADVGTHTCGLTFIREDGTTETGSITYTVIYTNDAEAVDKSVVFGGDVTAKVNGNSVTTGSKVVTGDKITFIANIGRGKLLKSISVNGTALALNGNSAEYTVADSDSAVNVAVETTDADSYTVTIPDNVNATVISDSGNILLANGSKVYDGEKVKISANVSGDKTLKSLKLNGADIADGSTVTVSGTNLNIEVEFETAKEVSITIPDGVTVLNSQSAVLKNGDKVTVGEKLSIFAAKDGYTIKTLRVNGTNFISGAVYTVTDADVKIEAEFNANTPANTFPVTIRVYDSEDSSVKGVTVLVKDSNKKTVATAETDRKGAISLDIAAGRYTYVVTDVPDGYLNPSGSHTFTVSDSGKVKGTTSVTISQSEVTLKKVDSITKNGVEGISIVVKNEDKETVASGVTNSKGELVINGLPEGTYTYSEKYAAPGYSSDGTVYKFSIDEDGDVTGTTTTETTPVSIVFSVRDYASGKGLKGATLAIKNQLGRTVATVITDDKGEASVPGLSAGRYTLSQVDSPAGYSRSTDEYTFDVLQSGTVTGTTSISNKEKSSSNTGTDQRPGTNGSQSATTPNASNGTNSSQSATTPSSTTNTSNGISTPDASNNAGTSQGSTTATTPGSTTTTTVTAPSGGKTQGTVKTGVETAAPKSKAPIIAGVIGSIGVVAGAVSVVINKIKGKKN